MARTLVSDFALLPKESDRGCREAYHAVYAQLEAMGIAVPPVSSEKVSRAELLEHLQREAALLLYGELSKAKYAERPDESKAALMNGAALAATVATEETKGDPSIEPATSEDSGSVPIHDILIGFPFAPNAITEADIVAILSED